MKKWLIVVLAFCIFFFLNHNSNIEIIFAEEELPEITEIIDSGNGD